MIGVLIRCLLRVCCCTGEAKCWQAIIRHIRFAYKPYFFRQRTIFFSPNKSANGIFSHDLSAKRTWLINQMVGQKLSIVTDKLQTTRHCILGICSEPEYQVSEFSSVQCKRRSSQVSGPIYHQGDHAA